MDTSDSRRQSDSLPSISYVGFDNVVREGTQFHQRHPSIAARPSISAISPISPTTQFQSPQHPFAPPNATANGYRTPPDSRKNSDNQRPSIDSQRQSLPSIQEALNPGSFSAPSPMQTPPVGSGSFSVPPQPSVRTNSMPRSQPSESQQSLQPPPPPPQPISQGYPMSHPHPPPPPIHKDSLYPRHDSQPHIRTVAPNPYSTSQPPPSIPAIQSAESYHTSGGPPPPPSHQSQQPYHSHPAYPAPAPHQINPPHYAPPPAGYSHMPSGAPHYSSYPAPPPPPPQQHSAYPPQQPPYRYGSNDAGYAQPPPPIHSPGKGVKRASSGGYGSTIERALSISAIRRDLDSAKESAGRIYHLIDEYQRTCESDGRSHPARLEQHLHEFNEAVQRADDCTRALKACQAVFQDLSSKENAEQQQYSHKMSIGNGSEYGTEDGQGYGEDARPSVPDKKIRRGRAAPPGRCHSCHRAETPEWRRGPDGARTLCNACGLHYAKLTRKLSKNNHGSSTLTGRKPPNSPLP